MLLNIYAIDLQIRRFCSNNKENKISTHRVQNYSGAAVHRRRAAALFVFVSNPSISVCLSASIRL